MFYQYLTLNFGTQLTANMRKTLLIIVILSGAYTSSIAQLNTKMDSISYSLGVDVGSNLAKTGLEINQDVFRQGLQDSFAGEDLA